eukprot:2668894-Lingulodinium_polyedra.AAC.1
MGAQREAISKSFASLISGVLQGSAFVAVGGKTWPKERDKMEHTSRKKSTMQIVRSMAGITSTS